MKIRQNVLKFIGAALVSAFATASGAALTPDTEFYDIPPTNTIRDIVNVGGTNLVQSIIRTNVETNYLASYDLAQSKIPMPLDEVVPPGMVLGKATNGVEWVIQQSGSILGPISYIRDDTGGCYRVKAELNPSGQIVASVEQVIFDPEEKTVIEEELRAKTAEYNLRVIVTNEIRRATEEEADLDDRIKSLSAVGRFLSTWNSATGKPGTEPKSSPTPYMAGDYYIVGNIGTNANYVPVGTVYTNGSTSTTLAADKVSVNDLYRHASDGSWVHVPMYGVSYRWEQIDGDPTNNTRLAKALDEAGAAREFKVRNTTGEYVSEFTYDELKTTIDSGKILFADVSGPGVGGLLGYQGISDVTYGTETHANALTFSATLSSGDAGSRTMTLAIYKGATGTKCIVRVKPVASGLVKAVKANGVQFNPDADGLVNIGYYATTNDVNALNSRLIAETNRAQVAEKGLSERIVAETNRAQVAEKLLSDRIVAETNRAQVAEKLIDDRLVAETNRSITVDKNLSDRIVAETNRAQVAEKLLSDRIVAETNRAQVAEKDLSDRIDVATNDIAIINSKIPDEATSLNKLSDKAWVEEQIRNAAATFRGSFDNWASVPTDSSGYTGGEPKKGDYITVQDASDYPITPAKTGTWLFRFTGASWTEAGKGGFSPEYKISTEDLTPEQKAALNSGITSNKVQLIYKNQERITNEIIRSANFDTNLLNRINAETNRAQVAEKNLNDLIVAETNRAQVAEKSLSDRIVAETNRAQVAEKLLSDRIVAETNRAQVAEKLLSDRIIAETNRANTAETNLMAIKQDKLPDPIAKRYLHVGDAPEDLEWETVKWGEITGDISNQTDLAKILKDKRDMTNRLWKAATYTPWTTQTVLDPNLDLILNNRTTYPEGAFYYATDTGSWACRYTGGASEQFMFMSMPTVTDKNATYLEAFYWRTSDGATLTVRALRVASEQDNLALTSEIKDLTNALKKKRDLTDLSVPERLMTEYLPIAEGGIAVETDLRTNGTWISQYADIGKFTERELVRIEYATGKLYYLGPNVTLGGKTPALGTVIMNAKDSLALTSEVTNRIAIVEKGATNGVATLDAQCLVPMVQLPDAVKNFVVKDTFSALVPADGKTNTIYAVRDTNKLYRFDGTGYVKVGGDDGYYIVKGLVTNYMNKVVSTNVSFAAATDTNLVTEAASYRALRDWLHVSTNIDLKIERSVTNEVVASETNLVTAGAVKRYVDVKRDLTNRVWKASVLSAWTTQTALDPNLDVILNNRTTYPNGAFVYDTALGGWKCLYIGGPSEAYMLNVFTPESNPDATSLEAQYQRISDGAMLTTVASRSATSNSVNLVISTELQEQYDTLNKLKRDTTNRVWSAASTTPWTFTFEVGQYDATLEAILNDTTRFPNGVPYYNTATGMWGSRLGENDTDEYGYYWIEPVADPNASMFRVTYNNRTTWSSATVIWSRTVNQKEEFIITTELETNIVKAVRNKRDVRDLYVPQRLKNEYKYIQRNGEVVDYDYVINGGTIEVWQLDKARERVFLLVKGNATTGAVSEAIDPSVSFGGLSPVVGDVIFLPSAKIALESDISGKRDLTNRLWQTEWYGRWNVSVTDASLMSVLNDTTRFPDGPFKFDTDVGRWVSTYGSEATDEWTCSALTPTSDRNARWMEVEYTRKDSTATSMGQTTRAHSNQVDLVITTEMLYYDSLLYREKRDVEDFYVNGRVMSQFLPITVDGREVEYPMIEVSSYYDRYVVYELHMEEAGTILFKTNKKGELTELTPGVLLCGESPAIGTQILIQDDNLVLASQLAGYQTNLVYTTNDNGKVLGLVNTNLAWVSLGDKYRSVTDLAVHSNDKYDTTPLRKEFGVPFIDAVLSDEYGRTEEVVGEVQNWSWKFSIPGSTNVIAASATTTYKPEAEIWWTDVWVGTINGNTYHLQAYVKGSDRLLTTRDLGIKNCVAPLGSDGLVPTNYLPEISAKQKIVMNEVEQTNDVVTFFAPTNKGTANYVLTSTGNSSSGPAPKWTDPNFMELVFMVNLDEAFTQSGMQTKTNRFQRAVWGQFLDTAIWPKSEGYLYLVNSGSYDDKRHITFYSAADNTTWVNTKINGVWSGWKELVDGSDRIPFVKIVENATSITNLFEMAYGKSWNLIDDNSSMFVFAKGLPFLDKTFPTEAGYCLLRYHDYRTAYIEFSSSYGSGGTFFNRYNYPSWSGWMENPLPTYNIESPTSYMDLFYKMGYVYNKDGFTASGIARKLNCDPAKGDYFPHPNMYVTVSSMNSVSFVIRASGFNQTGVLWERRQESGVWKPWTRIDGNVSQKKFTGGYYCDCDKVFAEAYCSTNSEPNNATIMGYGFDLNTAHFPAPTGFLTMRQIDVNNREIEFRNLDPEVPVKYNTKTNGVWTGWKELGGKPTDTLILNGDEDIITGPYVIPHGYGEEGQMLVSKGTNAPPEWSDQPMMVLNGTITNAIGPVVIPGGYGQKGQILVGNGETAPTWLANGTAGQMLVSGGANADPSWGDLPYKFQAATLSSGVSGRCYCYRYGRVVTIVFDQFNVSTSASKAGCVTIPAGFRPAMWVLGCLITTSHTIGEININPSTGSSELIGNQGTTYFSVITYITGDAMP